MARSARRISCDFGHDYVSCNADYRTIAGGVALDLEDACTGGEVARCRELLDDLERMSGELIEATRALCHDK